MLTIAFLAAGVAHSIINPWFALLAYVIKSGISFLVAIYLFDDEDYKTAFVILSQLVI